MAATGTPERSVSIAGLWRRLFGGETEGTATQAASPAGSVRTSPDGLYALKGVYFNVKSYKSEADCLTAAYNLRLPLDLCNRR